MRDRRRRGERKQGMREKERKSREEGQMEQMKREKEVETDKKTEGAEREDIVIQLSKQDVKHTQKMQILG